MEPIEFDSLLAVCALGNNDHIRDGVDERDEALTHYGLVVNYHDFDLVVIHTLDSTIFNLDVAALTPSPFWERGGVRAYAVFTRLIVFVFECHLPNTKDKLEN